MLIRSSIVSGVLGLLALAPAFAADSVLVVDRGLPQVNLNNSSGPVRSNVRWALEEPGFLGDSLTIGSYGERWVIDSIRTWTVPGQHHEQPAELGDFYQDVRLYFGRSDGDATPVAAGQMARGSNETGNPNIRITDATQSGAQLYDNFGTSLRIWQVDFTNLNLAVDGGVAYNFGAWGLGRSIPDAPGKTYLWFNHASNAGLSGAAQDGADGAMVIFDGGGRTQGVFRSEGSGWDKNSDVNVQIFAHRMAGHTTQAASLQ